MRRLASESSKYIGGVTRSWLKVKAEGGRKKNPSLDVLKRLARALGVPVTELLE